MPLERQRHIERIPGLRRNTLIMFRVSLPDAEVESWVPGWGKLSRAKKAAAEAVVREVALLAAERGHSGLSEAEREELARVCGEVIHWPQQVQAPRYGAEERQPYASFLSLQAVSSGRAVRTPCRRADALGI